MNLTDSCLKELENPSLTRNERFLLRCRLASELIHIGQYETAREALGELWQGVGRRPEVEKLKPPTAAEVLLQCGVLSGWLGRIQHLSGAQEKAKDLIFEALRMFKSERQASKVSEAKYELSMCYFRLGAYDDARVILDQALEGLAEKDSDLKAKILIRHTLVEVWTGRYHDAWFILEKASEFFEASSDALKGRWHGQRGLVLGHLATREQRTDYADRAIMEFTAAIFHYEHAKHERYCANNFNNLAMLLYQLGRYSEAHENLDRAQAIFERHQDTGNLAQIDETRARVFVAERYYTEANHIISGVIQTFEQGSEYAMLTDALTIQGVARARLGLHESSLQILRHAMSVAQNSGAYSNAGLAALALIEEHGKERLSDTELFDVYNRTDELLKETQDAEEIERLRECARLVMRRLLGLRSSYKGFTLPKAIHDREAQLIREALEIAQGVVSHAAKSLGVTHQTLVHALNTRHQDLLSFRTPAQRRRKSLIRPVTKAKKQKTKER
jgi:tetratricopeptide (TPR) repeat protein